MIHYHIKHALENSGDHYSVGSNSKSILLQIQENGEQARIQLTPSEAEHIILLLKEHIEKMKNS